MTYTLYFSNSFSIASSAISLAVCGLFLALMVLMIGFLLHRRRRNLNESVNGPVPAVQQVVSHGNLFSSRLTQTRLAPAQPKSSPLQAPTAQSAASIGICAVQQQLGQTGRPQTFNKPTAVKSPSSGYLKKSPSPTGQKSPPQLSRIKGQVEAQATPLGENLNKGSATGNVSQTGLSDGCRRSSKTLECVGDQMKSLEGSATAEETNSISSNVSTVNASSPNTLMSNKEETDSSQPSSHGRLQFKLKYSYEKNALCVSIIRGFELLSKSAQSSKMTGANVSVKVGIE